MSYGSNWMWSGSDRGTGSNWRGYGRGGGTGGRGNWRGGRRGFRGSQPPRSSRFTWVRGANRQQYPTSFDNSTANQQTNNIPKAESLGKRISEDEIGATKYVNDHEGFLGTIKSRCSDYQISEINKRGEVAKLTELAATPTPTDEVVMDDEEVLPSKYNLQVLPIDTWNKIKNLAMSKEAEGEGVQVDVTGMSKEKIKKMSDCVKWVFRGNIVGTTIRDDDWSVVRFDKCLKGKKGKEKKGKEVTRMPGKYTYFVLHKENCDTMEAAVRLSDRLKLKKKPWMLGYASTPDRRAKTSQWFCMRGADPKKVAAASLSLRDVHVGNFRFENKNLQLGMLQGNKFRMALRNVTAADEDVEAACRLLTERGFINYFGLQRFSSHDNRPIYDIGLKLLQGNLKEAIAGILEEREGPIQQALRQYKENGAKAALKVWPHAPFASIELRLLRVLSKNPKDKLRAFNKLARNARLLYLDAYQSLVWNRAVSERVRRAGLVPVTGDLVPLLRVDYEEEMEERESDNEEGAEESFNKAQKQKIPVKVLTQNDIDSGKYTIFDIVLPLPGSSVDYPPNMKEYYEELLAKDGLTLEMNHKLKGYILSGSYRHMVVKPQDVSWRFVRYSVPYCDLIMSDWDELEGKQPGIEEDGKYKALLLTMTLPASCYATMALRELLKVDTSCDNQALQNNYHKKKADIKTESPETKQNEEVETAKEESDGQTPNGNKCKMEVKSEDKVGEKRKVDSQSEEVNIKKLKKEV